MFRRGHVEARIYRVDESRVDQDEINHGETPKPAGCLLAGLGGAVVWTGDAESAGLSPGYR